jgi:hypothetical protein
MPPRRQVAKPLGGGRVVLLTLGKSKRLRYMNWTEQPATECQVTHLRQLGYAPGHPLTKGEAAQLISDFEENPGAARSLAETGAGATTKEEAHALRARVETARRAVAESKGDQAENAKSELVLAVAKRQLFWVNTCREPSQMQAPSPRVFELYRNHGCSFVAPTQAQAQEILDALDAAMPLWDRDYPQLFYQTLELNFPELRRLAACLRS